MDPKQRAHRCKKLAQQIKRSALLQIAEIEMGGIKATEMSTKDVLVEILDDSNRLVMIMDELIGQI